jgi:hypothetical protein
MRVLLPLLLIGALAHSVFGGAGHGVDATSTCAQWNAAPVEQRAAYTASLYTAGGGLQARIWIDTNCTLARSAGTDAETIPDPTRRP